MLTLVIYCSLIAIASGVGGMLPSLVQMTHGRMQMTLSLVCGVMLGVALLHLLPHSIQVLDGNVQLACLLVLCGLLLMLFLIRIFNFHHHDFDEDHIHSEGCCHGDGPEQTFGEGTSPGPVVQIGGTAGNPADPGKGATDASHPAAEGGSLSWVGLCFGLAIHTLMDGLALAAAFQAERGGHLLAGFGTFLAIALHKPLDAISITGLMAAQRFSVARQLVVNLIFALMAPLGAFLFVFLVGQSGDWQNPVLGVALAVSAGFFLCISLGDLLPEVHFHSHDRGWLSVMLMAGIAIAVFLEFVIGHPVPGAGR